MSAPRNAEELFNPDYQKPDADEAILGRPVNAADIQGLRKKALTDAVNTLSDEGDICEILAMKSGAGVRFIARVIERCGWCAPYFHPSNSIMSEVAGRRAVAWDLENWISNAGLDQWFLVRRELEVKRPKPKVSERKT